MIRLAFQGSLVDAHFIRDCHLIAIGSLTGGKSMGQGRNRGGFVRQLGIHINFFPGSLTD
jgi:hypothetical protein